MQLATEKGPITYRIPGFSMLRTVRPTEEQRCIADVNPQAGIFFKSPTESIHVVVSTNQTYRFVNTIRVDADNNVRFGRVMLSHSVRPELGVTTYEIPNHKARGELRSALNDLVAFNVLTSLLANKEQLVPAAATCGRDRHYTAYLENLDNSMTHLELNSSRHNFSAPAVGITTHFGDSVKSTIAFSCPLGEKSSLRPEVIRTITADANIRSYPDYVRKIEGIMRAAGLFNLIVQAQNALPSRDIS